MKSKRIVIVDDCRLSCAIAKDILTDAGFDVVTATTGLEANPHIYGSPRPDLILLDIEMPMLKGDQKVRLLKERPSSKDIPVLLISSKREEDLAEIARLSGADGFLCKPLRKDSLFEALARFQLI